MPYGSQDEYNKHQVTCSCDDPTSCSCEASQCGCCPIGTIAVTTECGKHLGCLTPEDAAQYDFDTIDVPEGFIKLIDPTSGNYLGLVSVADYCAFMACQGSAVSTIHIVSPRAAGTLDVNALSINSTDGNNLSGDQVFWADRNGYAGAITLEIISPDGITFVTAAGTTIVIPAEASVAGDEFEKTGAPLASGSYDISLEWRKADATVMRTQTITFIVP